MSVAFGGALVGAKNGTLARRSTSRNERRGQATEGLEADQAVRQWTRGASRKYSVAIHDGDAFRFGCVSVSDAGAWAFTMNGHREQGVLDVQRLRLNSDLRNQKRLGGVR